ncbi:MAG: hypothetical protein ACOY33_06920 [Pseudomonadota bacterium]
MKSPLSRLAATSLLLLAGQTPALAADGGVVELLVLPSSDLDITFPGFGSARDDGNGFGLRVGAESGGLRIHAEYQNVSLDLIDEDIEQLRAGLGFASGESVRVAGRIEMVNVDMLGAEASGAGLHFGLEGDPAANVTLFATVGRLMLEDETDVSVEGPEINVGFRVQANRNVALSVDLRDTALEEDSAGVEFDLSDLRLGIGAIF